MFGGMENISTGVADINGKMIHLGDTVETIDGFSGQVVFANGAYRVDIHNGEYLRYNSSLLFSESGEKRFKIVEGKR